MKYSKSNTSLMRVTVGFKFVPPILGLILLASGARADNWFDVNGTAAGYGTVAGGSYSWDDPNWATVVGGTNATGNWVQTNFARFLGTGSYTITVNNSETNAGLFQAVAVNSGFTVTINAAGSGNLWINPNSSLTTGLPVQGYFCNGGNSLVINAPITGTGGINFGIISGTGNISLNGNNTYSGGSTLTTSSYNINFNNNNSFGTGPININGTTFANLLSQGGTTITLGNNFTNTANSGINFGSAANTPVVLTGPVALQTFSLNLRNNGNSTAPLTLQGPISGTNGALTLSANNNGTIIFSGANTYTGPTSLGGNGSSGVTLSVSSLNSVSGGSPSSNLGQPTNIANGTITIGSGALTSTLIYTGPGETSDRVINLGGTTGGAILQADGAGALVLTSTNSATGAGVKSLTLQGSNIGANSIGKIVNSSSATAVVKAQGGSWKLTATNTYTGGTTVNGGTLEVSGAVPGSVTNNSGILTLDNASTLASNATLAVSSGTTVNLNYSGTNAINALVIDGSLQVSGLWGPPSSAAPNQNPIFAGTGYVRVLGKPVITDQPVGGTVFPDASFTFTVGVVGDFSTLTYQWKQNGVNISGANASSYTISPVEAANAGDYSCWITNSFGFTNTVNATLTVLGTNAYTQIVRGDTPVSYWRLGETNGTVANDAVGGNNGTYTNVRLNQSGYAVTDSDPAIGLPSSGAPRGYMQVTNVTPFVINGSSTFTFECWAYFTNLTTKGRLFSTLNLANPNGYAFGVLPGGTGLELTSGAVADNDVTLGTALVPGQWYHIVCACDGNNYYFYLNGAPVGAPITVSGHAPNGTGTRLQLGANPPAYTTGGADGGAEQVFGRIDEAAFYNYALSQTQVTNHFTARYATLAPPIVFAPIVNPATNYESLSATLQADAAGTLLTYQWYKAPSTLLGGKTDATLTLSPLQLSDAGNYFVQVSNPAGTSNSPNALLSVLAIPSNAAQLNLTNGLVLHLPFDSDYADISGHANNGTSVGATSFTNAAIGSNALHYSSDAGSSSFNYVTVGVRPDLQFSSNVDFTVSYWVRQPAGSTFTNLPFFTDAVGSTGHGGFAFAPYQTATTAGGWILTIGGMSTPSQFTSFPDQDLINDGNWHNLVHVASRVANVTTYLDGVQVDSEAISFVGNINTTNAATIGQDPTGTYPVTAQADLDDLAVWRRTLTPLEISGLYLAGATNHVSFAPAVANPIVQVALQIVQVAPGQYQIVWTGPGTLTASGGVLGTYTNVPGASSPYTIPTSSGPQLFYRLKY